MHKDAKEKKSVDKGQVLSQEQHKRVKLNQEEDPYRDIRLGGVMSRVKNWWEEDEQDPEEKEEVEEEENNNKQWNYLEHHGPLFPPFFQRHFIPLIYEGRARQLSAEQEELCTYWAQSIGTPWEEKPVYRKNFTEMMKTKLDPEFELEKCDFGPIRKHLDHLRQLRLNRSEEVKKQEKVDKEQRDKIYGYALVDGCLERLGNYTLELPTLFKGRGEHPKAGLLKARTFPEDLTINVSTQAPVPKCALPGHAWGNIVSRNDVTWLVSYVDSSVKKDNHKYVQFAATSRFKQMNDKRKYEKARKLKACIGAIREDYMQKLTSDSIKQRMLGTATYLIDKLALRVGNEKDEDEADTVGCCSLRVQHVQILDNNRVAFDFLGKDSMRYYNEVQLHPQVCANLRQFQKGKKEDTNLFHDISTDDLNDYLKTQMKGLTAKVFRTYNASFTLQQELDKGQEKLDATDDLQVKVYEYSLITQVDYYDHANKQVAILCNHQKTVPKSFEITKNKILHRLQVYKTYLAQMEDAIKSRKLREYEEEVDLDPPEDEKDKKANAKKKLFVKKFFSTKDKQEQQIQKIRTKVAKEEAMLVKKEENKEIALGTSKTNYNDPRISVAWCKLNDVPIEKVFQRALRDKFIWAMATDHLWKF